MILCVAPDEDRLAQLRTALEDAGFQTTGAGTLAAAETKLADGDPPTCVVTTYNLPDGTGLDVARRVRETAPDATCILFTATPVDDIDTTDVEDVILDYQARDTPDALADLVDRVQHSTATRSQTAYPVPDDEDARLDALDRFDLDQAGLRDALDRLTELATAHFGVDSAAVGVIGDHEKRYLSCNGASFDDVDREQAICTYAILDPDVTVIEDVATDPRFADDQALVEANIRFYASAPLTTPDGHPIGTFCIYHHEPRDLDERDRRHLHFFADEAMDQLRLRAERDTHAGQQGADG